MALILDSISPVERVRLIGALGKASAQLGAAQSAIDKIKAAGTVRDILSKIGVGPVSAPAPVGIRIDPADKEASIRSIREYLSEGIKAVPRELRPFEQKMVAQLAATLGELGIVNVSPDFKKRDSREAKQLAAFNAVSANGVDPGVDTSALAVRVTELSEKLRRAAGDIKEYVARATSELQSLNMRYRAEYSRMQSELEKAHSERRFDDVDRIHEELVLAERRYKAEFNEVKDKAEKHIASANKSGGRYAGYEELAPEGQKVIAAVMAASKVSDADAKAWAKRQKIDPSTVAKLKRRGYKESTLRQDMADFYRISGGRIPEIEITSTSGRAHASGITAAEGEKRIAVGDRFDRTVLFHELAHHIEADEIAKAASNGFLVKRRKSPQVSLLSEITGSSGYSDREVAYEDEFLHPYIGKVYPDSVTEVFSMGMEHLATPGAAALFAAKDPEMFAMVTGYLSQEITPAMRAMIAFSTGTTTARKTAGSNLDEEFAAAVKSITSGILLESNPNWELKPGFQHEWSIQNNLKRGSKQSYVGSAGNYHVYQGIVRGQRTRRWTKGYLVVWDRNGYLDIVPTRDDLSIAKAVIALSMKTSQPPFVVHHNYIDSGRGDRRNSLIDFVKANS